MKTYTDLEQSKKLAGILPLESADMIYMPMMDIDSMSNSGFFNIPECYPFNEFKDSDTKPLPCWSLAALLDVLPDESDIVKGKLDVADYKYMCTVCIKEEVVTAFGNNLLDACYELIIKLYKRKLL